MLKALERAAKRSPRIQRHATAVLRGGSIIALGVNTATRHAEESALKKLWPSKRRGTSLLNLRLKPSGMIGDSRPCLRCREFAKQAGVSSIFYTDDDGGIERIRL